MDINPIVKLDVTKNIIVEKIKAKQYDTARFITVYIYDNGVFKSLSEYTENQIQIKYKKPDGKSVNNNAKSINSDGSVTFALTEQMLAIDGEAEYEVCSIVPNNIWSTHIGYIVISPSAVANSEIESSYEFNALNAMMERVEGVDELIEDIQDKINIVDGKISSIATLENNVSSNETTRKANEITRENKEIIRQNNEEVRIANENNRETNTLNAIANCEDAKNATELATTLCITATTNAQSLIKDKIGISDTTISPITAYSNQKVDELIAEAYDSLNVLDTKKLDKSSVVDGQSTNVKGFVLDATQINPSITGSFASDMAVPVTATAYSGTTVDTQKIYFNKTAKYIIGYIRFTTTVTKINGNTLFALSVDGLTSLSANMMICVYNTSEEIKLVRVDSTKDVVAVSSMPIDTYYVNFVIPI